jgi:hypothetical protein
MGCMRLRLSEKQWVVSDGIDLKPRSNLRFTRCGGLGLEPRLLEEATGWLSG